MHSRDKYKTETINNVNYIFENTSIKDKFLIEPSYYDLLDIKQDSNSEQIKAAYKKQALLYHPDKGSDPEKFKHLIQAKAVLNNIDRRKQYDDELLKYEEFKNPKNAAQKSNDAQPNLQAESKNLSLIEKAQKSYANGNYNDAYEFYKTAKNYQTEFSDEDKKNFKHSTLIKATQDFESEINTILEKNDTIAFTRVLTTLKNSCENCEGKFDSDVKHAMDKIKQSEERLFEQASGYDMRSVKNLERINSLCNIVLQINPGNRDALILQNTATKSLKEIHEVTTTLEKIKKEISTKNWETRFISSSLKIDDIERKVPGHVKEMWNKMMGMENKNLDEKKMVLIEVLKIGREAAQTNPKIDQKKKGWLERRKHSTVDFYQKFDNGGEYGIILNKLLGVSALEVKKEDNRSNTSFRRSF